MANTNGKKARKTGGNRYDCKKSKAKARTGNYAKKLTRWAGMEKHNG